MPSILQQFPKLKSSRELKAKGYLSPNGQKYTTEHPEQIAAEEIKTLPEGIFCLLETSEETVLARSAFALLQGLLDLLELHTKDQSGLPLQLYPHFEQEEQRMGFLLTTDEELLVQVQQHFKKINRQFRDIQKGLNIKLPQTWLAAYQKFLKTIKDYRQSLYCCSSEEVGAGLFDISPEKAATLLDALVNLGKKPKPVELKGYITGISQNRKVVEFKIASKRWNGIRTKKEVYLPITTHADKGLVDFAIDHLNEEVEIQALKGLKDGQPRYQLRSITVQTQAGPVTQRVVHEGPRGGRFYLNYRGKKIYLGKN